MSGPICISCLDFNCEGDCFTPEVPTQKTATAAAIFGKPKGHWEGIINAVSGTTAPILRKCTHCRRLAANRCAYCGVPVCPLCAWPTRTPKYKQGIDLCHGCRDSAVTETNNS